MGGGGGGGGVYQRGGNVQCMKLFQPGGGSPLTAIGYIYQNWGGGSAYGY